MACPWPSSMDVHSAVHVDHGAGRVARQVGGQEQEDLRDVVWLTEAAERNAGEDLLLLFGSDLADVDVGDDQAGRDAVDPEGGGAGFSGNRLGEAEHPRLGGGMVRSAENAAAALRGDRWHAGDRAGLL